MWKAGPFLKITDCAKKLGGALFLVGEIGGNDYNYAFFQKRSIEAVKAYVPQVVKSIMDFTKASSSIRSLLPKWRIHSIFYESSLSRPNMHPTKER
jgi:high-affinity Fe2+/Pb2+ permease